MSLRRIPAAVLCSVMALWSRAQVPTGPVYTVLRVTTLVNNGDRPIANPSLSVPVPQTGLYQTVYDVRVAPAAAVFSRKADGDLVADVRFDALAPGHGSWALVAARFRLHAVDLTRHQVPGQRLPPWLREHYLGSGELLDPRSPDVTRRAERLARGVLSRQDLLQRISSYVVSTLDYHMDDLQVDVDQTLRAGEGSCSELARVFVALARNRGIPCRFVSGSRLRAPVPGYVDDVHHRWVEAYLDGRGWFPVDVSRNVSSGDPLRYFGAAGSDCLALSVSGGGGEAGPSRMVVVPEERRVRTYWFPDAWPTVAAAVEGLGQTPGSADAVALYRAQVARLPVALAVPFLELLLYEPLAQGDPLGAVRALATTGRPSALVPLVDFYRRRPALDAVLNPVLQELTGADAGTPEAWFTWLRSEGRRVLQGGGR